MSTEIKITGLTELTRRMADFPNEYNRAAEVNMKASLLVLHENVPAYPPQPYALTRYRRTGRLGGSLGVSQEGVIIGSPDIFKAEKIGGGWQGTFGSNVEYAGKVIGEFQQPPFVFYWWNVKTIARASQGKIESVWALLGEKLAKFLEMK
jgi:hypothetical protein